MTDKDIRKYLIKAIDQVLHDQSSSYINSISITNYILKYFNLEFKDKSSKRRLDNN